MLAAFVFRQQSGAHVPPLIMAAKIVFVLFLSVLLRASLSLPVSLDVKTVQSTDSVPESGLTERTLVLDSETILRLEEDKKLVQSKDISLKAFESFETVHAKRIKRQIMKTPVLCPKDRIEYGDECITEEQYTDDLEGLDEYVAES